MKRLIAMGILVLLATIAWAYDPPTDAELNDWWASLSRAERLDQLRKLDEVEHVVPTLEVPSLVLITTADEVRAYWHPEPKLTVSVAEHLEYVITLPTAEAEIVSAQWGRSTWFGVGVGTGVVASILIALALP